MDIFLSCDRKLNYSPNPIPRPHPRPTPNINKGLSLRDTLKWAIIHTILIDLFTLPTLLRHHNLYNPDDNGNGTRDFQRWCTALSSSVGLPVILVKMGLMGCYAGTVFCGLQGGWEIARLVGVGSGLWADEEWVGIMDRPHLSTSMLDLWGKRYHQVSRGLSGLGQGQADIS